MITYYHVRIPSSLHARESDDFYRLNVLSYYYTSYTLLPFAFLLHIISILLWVENINDI